MDILSSVHNPKNLKMCSYLLYVFIAIATLMGVCVESIHIEIHEGEGPCCPNNTNLKCCCERTDPIYRVGKIKTNWWTANMLCKQNGMDLATILCQDEENALSAYLVSISSAVGVVNGVWIGASNEGLTGYYWEQSGQPVLYNAFLPGTPSSPAAENCVEWLISSPGVNGWNDYSCALKLSYVCQSRRSCI